MSDRPRSAASGIIPSASSRARPTGPASGVAGVRRNLFQSQLTRRPTPSSSNSAETLRLDVEVLSDSDEIVVRDKHGEIDLGDPPTPVFDEPEELGDEGRETEKERQRLVDAVKSHQINQTAVPNQPEELLEAVRASLRAKVAALAEDNWMFEPEQERVTS